MTAPLPSVFRSVEVKPWMVNPPVLKLTPARVEVAVVEAEIVERYPLKVEVESVPRTFKNPWRVEVPVVRPWMVLVEVLPT